MLFDQGVAVRRLVSVLVLGLLLGTAGCQDSIAVKRRAMRVRNVERTLDGISRNEARRPQNLREARESLLEMVEDDGRQRRTNEANYREAWRDDLRDWERGRPYYRENARRVWDGDAARARRTAAEFID